MQFSSHKISKSLLKYSIELEKSYTRNLQNTYSMLPLLYLTLHTHIHTPTPITCNADFSAHTAAPYVLRSKVHEKHNGTVVTAKDLRSHEAVADLGLDPL